MYPNFPPKLSVVIPIFNEEGTLPELYRRLSVSLLGIGLPYEIIFVDDGSADGSSEILEKMAATETHVRVVQLSRNFGISAAVTAGLEHATGELVALMDGDLQDPPEELARLVAKVKEGYEVVYAIRVQRKESAIRRAAVYVFYRILNLIASTPLPVDSGLFCVMTRPVCDMLTKLSERTRYISGLRAWAGFRQCGIPVERGARHAGSPRQTLGKLTRLAGDGIISFSWVPLRLVTYAGTSAAILAATGIAWAIYMRFFTDRPPAGWTSTVLMILFVGGIQLLALGIIGEYIGRIYDEVKARPLYVIRRRLGFPKTD